MLKKLILAVVIATVVICYFALNGQQYVSVEFFQQAYRDAPLVSAAIFFLIYFLAAAFSLPLAAVLTVMAGMVFGLFAGTLLASFASSLGATVACLFSRYLLRDWVRGKLGSHFDRIDQGLKMEGASYLFTLRLIPVFPFWVLNLAFGLTRMTIGKFYLVSQLGMLPGTMVYVNAGAQLGAVESFTLQGVMTPGLLGSFLLLALFPYIARAVMGWRQRRKVYAPYNKPASFDTNLIVIGAGSAGLVTAYLAAAVKARVTLVEKHLMGGDCLNTGCVPSKALLRSAKAAHDIRKARRVGVDAGEPQIDFSQVMSHVHGAVEKIAPHDSVERYTELGVDCVQGSARLVSPWEVEVGGRQIAARHIVIASGASPRVPNIPGLQSLSFLTSENLWSLETLPERLLVMGGGPIGCEMAQAFQRLGSRVTLVQRRDRLLPKADAEAAAGMAETLKQEGVDLLLSSQVTDFSVTGDTKTARIVVDGEVREVMFDEVLVALGRQANTAGLGLENLNIALNEDGTVLVDDYLRSSVPNILACGDVAGPYQFTHASAHQAWYAAVNALFGSLWKFKVDYRLIPSVVYTDPEIAAVGLTEEQARDQGVAYEITDYPLSELDRAITEDATEGFVKILTAPGKDRILGVTIVGSRAGEMIMEFIGAMKLGKGLNVILSTIHPYPVFSEANKAAAGQWKRQHTPERLLAWVSRYHRRQLKN